MIATNARTRYEVVAIGQQRTVLVGYTRRKSQDEIIALLTERIRRRIHLLYLATGVDPMDWQVSSKRHGHRITAPGWEIQFSGRTQRDAVNTRTELTDTIYQEQPR